ncbi:MAG: hypothetical protein KDB79_03260 [Acidobacteria bacterium]|nr:hypothetical protein [Acidobacteriota bacterium]
MNSNFTPYTRAFFVWIVIILAESIHGTLRQLFLAPLTGDLQARRIAVISGSILIFAVSWIFIRWISAPSVRALFLIGLIWAVLTVLFEFVLGFYIFGFPFSRLIEDYDLSRGGLMGFGLLFMIFVPMITARLRR